MTRNKTGNSKFLRQFNETAILDLIRTHGSLSRAQLSELTGLSATAAGAITEDLIGKGYIHETGHGRSSGGRRPVLLELKPGSFYAAGFDMEVGRLDGVMVDITGTVACRTSRTLPPKVAVNEAADHIVAMTCEMLKQLEIKEDRLLGVGVSVPGMVDSGTGRIALAPNLGWREAMIPWKENKLGSIPLYVENEAMASAICENWLGACRDVQNFVCINISSGIGAGIFTHGKPYKGAGNSAGEVGHIVVDEGGPRCGCGNYGCLETLASTTSIVERARKLVRQGIVSELNTVESVESITMETITMAAKRGDEAAKALLLEASRYLAIAISNIVNTLNPSRIVLGKEFIRYADLVMDQIQTVATAKSLAHAAEKVEIVVSAIGEQASTLGAAMLPLKVLFGR